MTDEGNTFQANALGLIDYKCTEQYFRTKKAKEDTRHHIIKVATSSLKSSQN